jgi:N-acetylglucosaminyl-diphospho-decaprenol L-rhamnosyltransferase
MTHTFITARLEETSKATAEGRPASVLVVIVNYRTADLTIDCLRSLGPEVASWPGARVVVTDNASGDDSAARLVRAVVENGWGGWVTVQPLHYNGGFAAGNNAAVRPALASDEPPDYIWLLNPDTWVRPGALATLVRFLEERPGVGVVGSRLEKPDGSPQRSWFAFPSVAGEFEGAFRMRAVTRALRHWVGDPRPPEEACPVDWVAGASLMVRREVFDAVGLMDEGFFLYFEEVDFCLRARHAGWPCWYVPGARVVHLVGRSSGVSDPRAVTSRRRPRYWFAARRRYFTTHHGAAGSLLADLAWVAAFAGFRARYALLRKPVVESRLLLWDFIRFNFLRARA